MTEFRPTTATAAAYLAALTRPIGARGATGARDAAQPFAPARGESFAEQLAGSLRTAASVASAASTGVGRAAGAAASSATAGAGRAAAGAEKAGRAIAWARNLIGRQDWNGLCERFVEEAYGTAGAFPSATAAARAGVTHRGKEAWRSAPPGALLYFAPDATNGFHGHVGIALGGGRMISATSAGVREDRLDTPYWAERFTGWGEATRFPGRAGRSAAGA